MSELPKKCPVCGCEDINTPPTPPGNFTLFSCGQGIHPNGAPGSTACKDFFQLAIDRAWEIEGLKRKIIELDMEVDEYSADFRKQTDTEIGELEKLVKKFGRSEKDFKALHDLAIERERLLREVLGAWESGTEIIEIDEDGLVHDVMQTIKAKIEAHLGGEEKGATSDAAEMIHGKNCEKVVHRLEGGGYLHPDDDDAPYLADDYPYCGRCHRCLNPQELAEARCYFNAKETHDDKAS